MPLLEARRPLEYSIEFVRPQVTESDFVWDNFQDQIVIQSRLSKLVVVLQALKENRVDEPETPPFYPHSLPTVKAPSLKLFEYIEKNHSHSVAAARRPPEKVSESFNGSKKKAESALAPIRPRSPASPLVSLPAIPSRPSSSDRIPSARPGSRPSSGTSAVATTSTGVTHLPLPSQATADVSSQAEAKAIIMKMRARNSTRAGANSLMPQSSSEGSQSLLEDAFPESRLDAKTKAELAEFNHLIVSVKDTVMRDRASAKNELDYYRQFLPRAPSTSGDVTTTPRDDQTTGGTPTNVSAQALPGATGSHEGGLVSTLASAATLSTPVLAGSAKRSKPQTVTRAPGRLPTLATAPPSSDTLAAVESNQELSPVRTSVAAKKPMESPSQGASMQQSAKKVAPTSSSAATSGAKTRAKPVVTGGRHADQQESSSNAGSSSKRTPLHPQQQHRQQEQQPVQQQQQQRQQGGPTKKPVPKTPKQLASAKNQQPRKNKAREAEAALSDFDDPDPEVDDAPIFPDDLGGMRAALVIGGDDEDEY